MADEDARISALEGRIEALQKELTDTRARLAEAQLDQWKGRIDELEVQLSLGKLEATEQLDPVLEQLRNRWLDTREQLRDATGTAGDVFASLRSGVNSAWDDLRQAVADARKQADG